MPDLTNVPNIILDLIAVATIIGTFFAMRQGYNKRVNEIQDRVNEGQARVIAAYKEEVEGLRRESADQDKKIAHLTAQLDQQESIFDAIRQLLSQRGWRIIISGKHVTLEDVSGKQSNITPIKRRIKASDDEIDVS